MMASAALALDDPDDVFGTSDIVRLVMARKNAPLLKYEPILSSPSHRIPKFKKAVQAIIKNGYPMRGASYVFPLDRPLPWAHADRTIAYFLQAFSPISPILMEHGLSGDEACFEAATEYLNDWLKVARAPDSRDGFMWYDMAVGLRCYKIAYMTDVMMRARAPNYDRLAHLMTVLDWHRQVLTQDVTHHTNHGLYQVLGQIAMCRRFRDVPRFEEAYQQAQNRLDEMLNSQFFADGVHREHSPGYHWMLLGTLIDSMNAGLIEREDHLQLIGRIEESMSWFIQPNLQMPAFGDTDASGIEVGYFQPKDFSHPSLRYALSQGIEGIATRNRLRLFEPSGYAVFQAENPKTDKTETYLAQATGFHSQTHKHADHLTFVWHDRGEDLLVDSGHFAYRGKTDKNSDLWQQGFWYSDPKRIYVEKTKAHNCIEIDGQDYPRRGVKPYGSALRRTAQDQSKVYAIESECRPFKSIRHDRVLFISPRRFLIVFDWIKDNAEQTHDFRQWFHVGPKLDVTAQGYDLTITRGGKPFVSMVSLSDGVGLEQMVRGQSDPDIQGWVSHDKGS
ncbi:MAG TPA: heparinase II/III family protein, partial [Alphaproteobacteria bacterium]